MMGTMLVLAGTFVVVAAGPEIRWEPSSLTLIEPDARYGRMIGLPCGDELCAFSRDGDLCVRRVSKEGGEWLPTQRVDSWDDGPLTNAELLVLRDGTVFLLANARPSRAMREQRRRMPSPSGGAPRFDIRLYRSHDSGRTWGAPEILFTAGHDRNTGCWEPAAIELPDGEIHVYFANEAPYPKSGEQEISLLRSTDGGRTWGGPETIGFRRGHRDGMPSPLVLRGGGGIAVAIEDNGWGGPLKPAILFTALDDAWRSGIVTGGSPRRWFALAEPPLAAMYGGAPYLRQMPSGETLLSFQEQIDGPWQNSRMTVCVGNERAQNFVRAGYPFPEPTQGGQLWNSLYVRDENTLVALSTTTIEGVPGLWSIEGRFRPGTPTVETGGNRGQTGIRD